MSFLNFRSIFVFHYNERVYDSFSRLFRSNDIVNEPTLSCLQRVSESFLIVSCLFFYIFTPEDDFYCTLSAHHCNFGIRPGVVEITSQVLGRHHIIGSSICFARNECEFGNRSLSIGIEEFSSVFDNTSVLLNCSRHESRDINKSNQGNLESIAEADEPSCFHRGINVQAPC